MIWRGAWNWRKRRDQSGVAFVPDARTLTFVKLLEV